MNSPLEVEHHEPGRGEAVVFFLKTRVFIARRWWFERKSPVPVHPVGSASIDAPVIAETKAPLWTQITEAEFPLTAGKVQNLRAASLRLQGLEIPAGQVFSFWKQLGRTTRRRGFTAGRELRSGCLVPNLGGGLCQLSGLLHAAAINAGIEVVERHAHSRSLPGVTLMPENDATVFWNYVDLRFVAPFAWRLECRLSATHLVVSIRATDSSMPGKVSSPPLEQGPPVRAAADGDCLTCGVTSCFRHPSANRDHAAAAGHTAWLLDARWPEFDDWCQRHAHEGDRWLTPLDGQRWNKPNYAWHFPAGANRQHATFETLRRSFRQRRLPVQGAVRQRFLLEAQRQLAETFARQLDPKARHLVVAQTLLPHLWKAGHLGGRTFDVLVNRWPLAELQARLDAAAKVHPKSETLADFRADRALVQAETEALAAAARLVTPHRAIAAHFGSRALLADWIFPNGSHQSTVSNKPFKVFFPASALGRKGIHELAAALSGTDTELLVLGAAGEGSVDPLSSIKHRRAALGDLASANALVIPAWIEHEPRIALRALASGIPVIASRACGLPPHPLLTEIEAGDVAGLRSALDNLTRAEPACAVPDLPVWDFLGRLSAEERRPPGIATTRRRADPNFRATAWSRAAAAAKARVSPELEKDLSEKGLHLGDPVFLRAFKEERVLESWIRRRETGKFEFFRSWPIAGASGAPGPKLAEGDSQVPEGFYVVTPERMKPDSQFHLAFNLGYPNAYDLAHQRTGTYIMIHGNECSVGCLAMTDAKIEEIYTLCDAALKNGQPFFRVHVFPFRMTSERLTAAAGQPWEDFWKNLKEGYDLFEKNRVPPAVEVEGLRYIFR